MLRGLSPGAYPRGGKTHLRIWLAERLADEAGVLNLAVAPALKLYARALGVTVGKDVDLHSLPPVTGLLTLGDGCSVEAEVDLAGYWLDGDVLHVGPVAIGENARIGTRSTLGPGAAIGASAEVGAGSAVFGEVPSGEYWSGAPAVRAAVARGPWSDAVTAEPAALAAGVRRLRRADLALSRWSPYSAECSRSRPGYVTPPRCGTRSGPRPPPCRWPPWSGWPCWP